MSPANEGVQQRVEVSSAKRIGMAAIVFILTAFAAGGSLVMFRSRSQEIPEGGSVPVRFPVIVVEDIEAGSSGCRVSFLEDIYTRQDDMPPLSYLVPEAVTERCNSEISAQREFATWGRDRSLPLWSAHAKFSPISEDGTQQIEVSASWDDDWINRGWYEASPGGIRPLRYVGFGAGIVLSSISVGIALGLVVAVATLTLARRGGAQ